METLKSIVLMIDADNTQPPEAPAAPAEDPAAEPAPEAPEAAPEAPEAGVESAEHRSTEETPAPKTYTRDEAEALFLSEMAPKLMRQGRQATASHAASLRLL